MTAPADAPGGATSPATTRLLREAAAACGQAHRREAILWSAQAIEPTSLPVYFALYKFYCHQGRLEQAEAVVARALAEAARQGGFGADWRLATAGADWAGGAHHFFLFSLKALAFIRLRRHCPQDTRAILAKLAELDPHDSVGASVVGDLLRGAAH